MEQPKQKLNWISIVDESELEMEDRQGGSLPEATSDTKEIGSDLKDDNLSISHTLSSPIQIPVSTCEMLTKNNRKCPNLKKKGDDKFCALHRHYYETKCRNEQLNSVPKNNFSREVVSTVPKKKEQDNLEILIENKVKQKIESLDENAKTLLKFLLC